VLKLLNVESAYGPIKAIRGVSLQVRRGEIATVLGSNGAGKTTILKTISGIIDPRKGSIEFKGEDITAKDPAFIVQQGLSHVPEGREVFPLLSVHDNLLMGAYTRKRPRRRGARHGGGLWLLPDPARARRAGRRPAVGRPAADAGHLARADGQPRPDPAGRAQPGPVPKLTKEIFEIVVRINRERGTTILLVEQNANMALNASDYGYVLENGRIVMEDTCARLREKDDIKEFYLGMKEDRRARRAALEEEEEPGDKPAPRA
jgi:branched-chain amino acid transport system ATP-binding protein